jgi:hypothetical protein
VMNFPDAPRGQLLLFNKERSERSRANLNETSSYLNRTDATFLKMSREFDTVAETWIFQPCKGSSSKGGLQ